MPLAKWISVGELALALGKSARTARMLCEAGAIPGATQLRDRGHWMIPRSVIDGNDGNDGNEVLARIRRACDRSGMRTERIDGTEYIVGTPEHGHAVLERQRRLDAAYLHHHRATIGRNQAALDNSGLRLDSNQSAFLARDLVFVRREVERAVYDKLRAAEFVPVDTSIPRGAQTYATRMLDQRGEANISADLSANDAPRADISISEDVAKLVNVTGSYGYSLQELEYSAYSGIPLAREKALACAEMIARGLDKVGRIGDAKVGVTGFFNNPLVPKVTLTNGEWGTATAEEILADLFQIEQAMITQSRDQHAAEVLILPTTHEGRLRTLRANTQGDFTVAEWFLKNARMIKRIERWIALDDATGSDVAVSDPPQGIAVASSPEVLFWPIPVAYEELAPEVRGFSWIVNARARCGGVEVRRPNGMLYIENLD